MGKGKPSEIWKEIKPRIGDMVAAANDMEQSFDKAVREAYENGYLDAAHNYHEMCDFLDDEKNEAYQRGLNDAWEAVMKMALCEEDGGLDAVAYGEIFGYGKSFSTVLKTFSASEAVEEIRQYEQEKEELGIQGYFKKGEEVIDADGTKAVVLNVSEDNYCQVYTEKGCTENWHIHTYKFHKTGRHFPEIAEVLQKMKENHDNK